ncbi:hypothetical protein BH10BAC4_BH10BAC4_04540 [soil metagenome]
MINPYSCYAFSFTVSLLVYGLGWSQLYPSLTGSLIAFVGLTIVLHLILGLYWKSKVKFNFIQSYSFLDPLFTTVFIYLLWMADFIYEGGIPLFKILLDQPYNYRLFGIPSLHVFTVTFGSFFTIYLFSLYIIDKKKKHLILFSINLFAALLIYSRAMLLFNISSAIFVYFLNSPSLSWKKSSVLIAGVTFLVYFFGVLGTLRVSFETKEKYNSNLFLSTGQASTAFKESWIPNEFFWGYIYFSSPVANLQENITTFTVPPFSASRLFQHFNNEMLFDFISKRINRLAHIEREKENTLPGTPFNVSTVYSRSFSYLGWPGMFLMAVFVLLLPLLYIRFLPSNQYQISAIAIVSTMYLFLFYDNTIRFTGLGLQLVYPFLLPLIERGSYWFQKKPAL